MSSSGVSPGKSSMIRRPRRAPTAGCSPSSDQAQRLGRLGGLGGALAGALDLGVGGVEALDVLHDQRDLAGLLVVDAALDHHDLVELQRRLGGGERLLEHHQLDRALEVVERGEHQHRARAGADLLGRR